MSKLEVMFQSDDEGNSRVVLGFDGVEAPLDLETARRVGHLLIALADKREPAGETPVYSDGSLLTPTN